MIPVSHSKLRVIPGVFISTALIGWACRVPAAVRIERSLDRAFTETVHPFLETYCYSCHNKEKQKGKLDLQAYSTRESVAKGYRQWEVILDKLKAQEMPPEEAKQHPSPELRQQVINWTHEMRKQEARKNAGDPGLVLARRLSNAEYDYTIRDLTGVDLRPAREFPVDPANEAGFDNSGESLAMSPALLKKYFAAARSVADHVVFKPDGLVFAPHPMLTETDRDKYSVKRIIDFYQQQSTNYTDYFLAAWRFKHRSALGRSGTLGEFAALEKVSSKYLTTLWPMLTGTKEKAGPIAALQAMWRELPFPRGNQPDLARPGCKQMGEFVMELRQKLRPEFTNLSVRGIAPGSQPLVLWKDQQFAENRLRCRADALRLENVLTFSEKPLNSAATRALAVPTDAVARAQYVAGLQRFCAIFPDAFYVPERGLIFLKEDKESRGRLLSAGFHLMTGYLRDDAPLSRLLLDERQQRELDQLWEEFHFVTFDAVRQYKDFIFFERAEPPRFMQGAEYDFARSEDKDATSEGKIRQLADAYLAKARRNGGDSTAIQAIEGYFRGISADIRRLEQARLAAEPKHLQALLLFAERAFRRPLSAIEREEIVGFYRNLRENDGVPHEDAIRDAVASVLMSPNFCYRVDLNETGGKRPNLSRADLRQDPWKTEPLSGYALANRLSYFLWASLPDAALLDRARSGDLQRPRVLRLQTRRLLQNDRVRGFVTEFAGNWLDFRRFEEHNGVDRDRFKTFNNELRAAMFEEPIRFFLDVIRHDRSILDFLNAHDTFVNPVLARHYQMPAANFPGDEWRQVPDATPYARGGLLPMAVFLTKNAPGLRTSPVKRGYWVVRRLLGEQIPPPPPNVPELPGDEGKLGERTLREVLARHREDKSCAGCHARFDGLGLVFEGYGPIGERRDRDLGDRPVEDSATFPGGSEGLGIEGLRGYLRTNRQHDFLDNFCRKLLSYALGRTLLLSDDVLIDKMLATLAANGYRFSSAIETIVASPQFLTRRVSHEPTQ